MTQPDIYPRAENIRLIDTQPPPPRPIDPMIVFLIVGVLTYTVGVALLAVHLVERGVCS